MMLCPWLDNLFNNFYNNEPNAFYYMLVAFFVINYVINLFMVIPSKNTVNIKDLFIKIKSFFLFISSLFFKFLKAFNFFKNEIFLKSFLVIAITQFFKKIVNCFISWKPLFKRFSYFGFNRLTKSKFFKNIK